MKALETELDATLKELAPLLDKIAVSSPAEALDAEKVRELLERLEPLLKSGNPECLNCIDSLRGVEGSEKLIQEMEDFNFVPAIATLAELKKKWGCG